MDKELYLLILFSSLKIIGGSILLYCLIVWYYSLKTYINSSTEYLHPEWLYKVSEKIGKCIDYNTPFGYGDILPLSFMLLIFGCTFFNAVFSFLWFITIPLLIMYIVVQWLKHIKSKSKETPTKNVDITFDRLFNKG